MKKLFAFLIGLFFLSPNLVAENKEQNDRLREQLTKLAAQPKGKKETLQILDEAINAVNEGANPNLAITKAPHNGWTLLHFAADMGLFVEFLLALETIQINAVTAKNKTPLYLAAARGNSASVKALLEAGANKALQDFEGKTALAIAEDEKVINLLNTSKPKLKKSEEKKVEREEVLEESVESDPRETPEQPLTPKPSPPESLEEGQQRALQEKLAKIVLELREDAQESRKPTGLSERLSDNTLSIIGLDKAAVRIPSLDTSTLDWETGDISIETLAQGLKFVAEAETEEPREQETLWRGELFVAGKNPAITPQSVDPKVFASVL